MITQILTFIYKSISICIHHYTPWVRMLLEIIKNFVIAVFWCRYIPSDRVTTRPISVCSGAYINCHLYSVAHIMFRPSNPSKIPARAKISCSHFRVGLEPTTREHYRSCIYRLNAIWTRNFQARDFFIFILDQASGRRIVTYFTPNLQRAPYFGFD